jgi:hypothetical protein
MSPESSTELTVLDRATGELVDVRGETTERLASYIDDLGELRAQLAEGEAVVNDELLQRLDRDAAWTQRIGDFELKAPSPTAGTESYDAEVLEGELRILIANETISEEAAGAACRRQLTLCLEVPWDADPGDLADRVQQALAIEVGGHQVRVLSASGSVVPVSAGIAKLRKLGVGKALDRAREEPVTPPRRRVKVAYKGSRSRL